MRHRTRFTLPKSYRETSAPRGRPKAGTARRKHPKKITDYGHQLREKQKVKFTYGLREKQFANYVAKAGAGRGDSAAKLFALLEARLDSAVFRLGFAELRSVARQIVSHGHMTVNGRRVTIPSLLLRAGDKVAIRPQSRAKGVFKDLDIRLKRHAPPVWLSLDKEKKEAEFQGVPNVETEGLRGAFDTILEFYSR